MATAKTDTKTVATKTTEVKTRKPREVKDRYIVTRPHPKFEGLHQTFTGTGWVLLEMTPNWEANAVSIDVKTTQLVAALIGGDAGVKIKKAPTGKSSGALGDILDGINAIGDAVDAVGGVIDAIGKLDTTPSVPPVE
jgi:hypothetical protein